MWWEFRDCSGKGEVLLGSSGPWFHVPWYLLILIASGSKLWTEVSRRKISIFCPTPQFLHSPLCHGSWRWTICFVDFTDGTSKIKVIQILDMRRYCNLCLPCWQDTASSQKCSWPTQTEARVVTHSGHGPSSASATKERSLGLPRDTLLLPLEQPHPAGGADACKSWIMCTTFTWAGMGAFGAGVTSIASCTALPMPGAFPAASPQPVWPQHWSSLKRFQSWITM